MLPTCSRSAGVMAGPPTTGTLLPDTDGEEDPGGRVGGRAPAGGTVLGRASIDGCEADARGGTTTCWVTLGRAGSGPEDLAGCGPDAVDGRALVAAFGC